MHQLTSGIVGGAVGLCVMGLFVPEINGARMVFETQATVSQLQNINRTAKGDRRTDTAPSLTGGSEAVTTEVLGGISVVHRDREGRILSRVDQAKNVTYIAKTVASPDRNERGNTTSRPRTNERMPGIVPTRDMPVGCESAVSVTADPVLARTASRCIS